MFVVRVNIVKVLLVLVLAACVAVGILTMAYPQHFMFLIVHRKSIPALILIVAAYSSLRLLTEN